MAKSLKLFVAVLAACAGMLAGTARAHAAPSTSTLPVQQAADAFTGAALPLDASHGELGADRHLLVKKRIKGEDGPGEGGEGGNVDDDDVAAVEVAAAPEQALTVAGDAEDSEQCDSPLDIITENGDLTSLLMALEAADMATTLDDTATAFTVLAPTDAALAMIPEDDLNALLGSLPALTEILSLHVLPGVYTAADFEGVTEVETMGGYMLAVAEEGGTVTFTGPDGGTSATVTEADLMTCEGVVHKIDFLLVPGIPENAMPPSIMPAAAPEDATAFLQTTVSPDAAPEAAEPLLRALPEKIAPEAGPLPLTADAPLTADDAAGPMAMAMDDGCESVVERASEAGDLNELIEAVAAADLVDVLGDPEAVVTVLAPTDSAFAVIPEADLETLLNTPAAITEILSLHVLPGVYTAADFEGVTEVETMGGYMLAVAAEGSTVTFTGPDGGTVATVTEADLMTCAGVVHKIDSLLVPGIPLTALPDSLMPESAPVVEAVTEAAPTEALQVTADGQPCGGLGMSECEGGVCDEGLFPVNMGGLSTICRTAEEVPEAPTPLAEASMPLAVDETVPEALAPGPVSMDGCVSIVELASESGDLNTLIEAVAAAELVEVLADPDVELTVLAPTDSAFAVIPEADLQTLLTTPAALTEILSLHVLPGVYTAADFEGVTEVETMGGYMLAVAAEGGTVTFTGPDGGTSATVTEADLMSCAGVVHKIDSLLIPGVPENLILETIMPDAAPEAAEPLLRALPEKIAPEAGPLPLTQLASAPVELAPVMAPEMAPEMPAGFMADAPAPGPAGLMGECPSILDLSVDAGDLTTLIEALDAAELTEVVADPNSALTVLAPTDSAFAVIPPNDLAALLALEPALIEILSLHVIPGVYTAAEFATMTEIETLGGAMLAVSTEGGTVTFTGPDGGTSATVAEADLMSCEGVVHKIDALLIPGLPETPELEALMPAAAPMPGAALDLPAAAPMTADCPAIVDLVTGADDLTLLATALEQATDLLAAISDPEAELTVLAPTDSAFAVIPEADIMNLMADEGALTQILSLHVLAGTYTAADFEGVTEVETITGTMLAVAAEGGTVTFTGPDGGTTATITEADLTSCAGVVHKINSLLIPGVEAS